MITPSEKQNLWLVQKKYIELRKEQGRFEKEKKEHKKKEKEFAWIQKASERSHGGLGCGVLFLHVASATMCSEIIFVIVFLLEPLFDFDWNGIFNWDVGRLILTGVNQDVKDRCDLWWVRCHRTGSWYLWSELNHDEEDTIIVSAKKDTYVDEDGWNVFDDEDTHCDEDDVEWDQTDDSEFAFDVYPDWWSRPTWYLQMPPD